MKHWLIIFSAVSVAGLLVWGVAYHHQTSEQDSMKWDAQAAKVASSLDISRAKADDEKAFVYLAFELQRAKQLQRSRPSLSKTSIDLDMSISLTESAIQQFRQQQSAAEPKT